MDEAISAIRSRTFVRYSIEVADVVVLKASELESELLSGR